MKSRNQPLTNTEIIAKTKQLSTSIQVIGLYAGSNKRIACRCRQCRYKWTPIWSNLIRGKGCPQCLRMRKGIAEITEELTQKFPTILILSREYIGVYDHLRFECTVCGHKWNRSWHKLKSGKGCPQCRQNEQRLSIDEIRRRLSKILPNVILQSCKYKNTKTPLKCECRRCGNKWVSSWGCLQQGCGCLRCSREKSAERSRLSLAEIKSRLSFINSTLTITSSKYTNNQSKLALFCHKCKHKWTTSWAPLSQGTGCPRCAGNLPLNLSEIRRRLRKTTSTVQILSGTYTSVNSVFKCKCRVCKHVWSQSWKSLQGGRGCPQCDSYESRFERVVRKQAELLTGLKFPKARPAFTKGLGPQPLEIDCFNAKLKLGIEPNGPHHYRLCYHNRFDKKLLQEQKRRDLRKRVQCWRHGVKLISVPYWIRDVKSYLSKRILQTTPSEGFR